MWLLSQLSGCASSSDGGKKCASLCGDLCKALAACDADVPSNCTSQCSTGVSGADCSDARPPDQLTCAELKATYACADYCATLCTKAPSCGSFDSKLCAQGCTIQSPSICNPASVEARSCDQLKPELRDYEDTTRAEQGGSHISIGGFGGQNPYGLCTKADDCALPLGCALETNTCSPCAADSDCKRSGFSKYMCSEQKECVEVECVNDADCSSSHVCDAQRHVCADCRRDSDCSLVYVRCHVETMTCVQCLSDADCTPGLDRCDLATNKCALCLTSPGGCGN